MLRGTDVSGQEFIAERIRIVVPSKGGHAVKDRRAGGLLRVLAMFCFLTGLVVAWVIYKKYIKC